jgi:hypothetical protein
MEIHIFLIWLILHQLFKKKNKQTNYKVPLFCEIEISGRQSGNSSLATRIS